MKAKRVDWHVVRALEVARLSEEQFTRLHRIELQNGVPIRDMQLAFSLNTLREHYNLPPASGSASERRICARHWDYCAQLLRELPEMRSFMPLWYNVVPYNLIRVHFFDRAIRETLPGGDVFRYPRKSVAPATTDRRGRSGRLLASDLRTAAAEGYQ